METFKGEDCSCLHTISPLKEENLRVQAILLQELADNSGTQSVHNKEVTF